MKKIIVSAVLAAGVCIAPAAQAVDMYVGLGLGKASQNEGDFNAFDKLQFEGFSIRRGQSSIDGGDSAYKLFFGADFSDYLGAELGYAHLGDIDVTTVGSTTGSTRDFLERLAEHQPVASDGFFGDVVGRYSFMEGKFGVFAKAGIYVWEENLEFLGPGVYISKKREGIDAHYGAGFQFNFLDNWSIRLEHERFDANTHMKLNSASVLYHFD